MSQKMNESEIIKKMELLKEKIPEVFSGRDRSKYNQKLIYNLLNIARSGNIQLFLWTLLRHLNARPDNKEVKEIAKTLNELYQYSSKFFEKWAYSIIMGIMSAKTEGGEKNE